MFGEMIESPWETVMNSIRECKEKGEDKCKDMCKDKCKDKCNYLGCLERNNWDEFWEKEI